MHVCVVGAGSLGSLIGGLCAREHQVTLVGRQPHVDAVRAHGLTISGAAGETTIHPEARTDVPATADLALVTVQADDTDSAARDLADAELGACCSLQNGLGNEATLAAHLDCPVLAGTCTYGARLVEPGHVRCTGAGEVALGPPDGGTSTWADRAGDALASAGIETTVATDMPRRLWEKLAVNAGVNATTALARIENGALAAGPAGSVARNATREAARVARGEGVDLPTDDALAALEAVVADTAANRSSMLQAVDDGARTEIDAINGAVVERADEPVPVNATLAALVRAWEAARGLRPGTDEASD